MSYDLSFEPPLGPEEFHDYFSSRPPYEVAAHEASYLNESTGVYFSFGDAEGRASFHLHYFRPHIFALEAEPEVAAFVENFGLEVDDTQIHGMGQGPYSSEGFLRGWSAGNLFGIRAILSREGASDVDVLPTREIERCWRWNFRRDFLQRELGEDFFVPKIAFLRWECEVRTCVVWPDSMAIALPPVDLLVNEFTLVPSSALPPCGEQRTGEIPYRLIAHRVEPIVSFFRRQPARRGKIDDLPPDQVLNAELVERARRGTR